MPASARNTEIASLLESFLDSNEDNLPPVMFKELDDLAEEIDSLVKDKDEEISDLKADKEDLEKQINELEEN
ncbi:hypothetical protein [Neobacillus sp. NPDC093127]|uniref:hypothetical protein n=1 Tax=Neobacillus sp. NPDC093127 TaxID=3364296 RepID=UPI00380BBF9A